MTPAELGQATAAGANAGKLELSVEMNPYRAGTSAWKVWRSMRLHTLAARHLAAVAQASRKLVHEAMRAGPSADDVERLMLARHLRRMRRAA